MDHFPTFAPLLLSIPGFCKRTSFPLRPLDVSSGAQCRTLLQTPPGNGKQALAKPGNPHTSAYYLRFLAWLYTILNFKNIKSFEMDDSVCSSCFRYNITLPNQKDNLSKSAIMKDAATASFILGL